MKDEQMNETEEYLLMIFLEENEMLDECWINIALKGIHFEWEKFKHEELGRTIPEEFEFFVDDFDIDTIVNHGGTIRISNGKNDYYKNKIKITVVENDR